eukprot:1161902-Pelagomonas_calceolata.AAC.11
MSGACGAASAQRVAYAFFIACQEHVVPRLHRCDELQALAEKAEARAKEMEQRAAEAERNAKETRRSLLEEGAAIRQQMEELRILHGWKKGLEEGAAVLQQTEELCVISIVRS